jgi:phenylacetate-CoA ligase
VWAWLPTLRRIVGRERNLIVKPDGSRHWPMVGFARFREVAPVSQYQLIQESPLMIEVRLVCERPPTPAEEEALRDVILASLGFPFALRFSYFPDRIPPSASGKYEEFICRVAPEREA